MILDWFSIIVLFKNRPIFCKIKNFDYNIIVDSYFKTFKMNINVRNIGVVHAKGTKMSNLNKNLAETLTKWETYMEVQGLINSLKKFYPDLNRNDISNNNQDNDYRQLDKNSFMTWLYDCFEDSLYGRWEYIGKWWEENIRKFVIQLVKLLKDRDAWLLEIYFDRDCDIKNRINFAEWELENSTDTKLDHSKLMKYIEGQGKTLKRRKKAKDNILHSLEKEWCYLNNIEQKVQEFNKTKLIKLIKIFTQESFLLQNKQFLYNFIKEHIQNIQDIKNRNTADFLWWLLKWWYEIGYYTYYGI